MLHGFAESGDFGRVYARAGAGADRDVINAGVTEDSVRIGTIADDTEPWSCAP